MSPDNWKSNPVVKRLLETQASLGTALPHFASLALTEYPDFTGLSIFLGDTNEFVVGVRKTDDDGTPMVLWSSGSSVLECLINMDKALAGGKWRVDKRNASPRQTDNPKVK